ncbi:MAG: DUF523 domain-containing protein [Candidatus Omnitrophica bacterium]|nr:DUF523 domain-containing protein [Candidatus Omnitrophota bacterium]
MCYVISACLIGNDCKYNGSNNIHHLVKGIFDKGDSLAVCPELLAGMGVPRPRTEIQEGDGAEVICGKGRVMSEEGSDVTEQFIRGAQAAYEMAYQRGITRAILKARSPSCGFGAIYDGSFSGKLKNGNGVLAQFLVDHGFEVKTEEEVEPG